MFPLPPSFAGGQTYKYADDNIAKDLKKDDFVVITKDLYNDCNDIVKAEKKQVKISGIKTDKYLIDGTWYDLAKAAIGADLDSNIKVGNTADVVIVNRMIMHTKKWFPALALLLTWPSWSLRAAASMAIRLS